MNQDQGGGWKEGKYGFWTYQVGRIGILSVGWTGNRDGSESGFQATVLGLRLKTLKPSLEEAKSHAEQQAKILLREAQEAMK